MFDVLESGLLGDVRGRDGQFVHQWMIWNMQRQWQTHLAEQLQSQINSLQQDLHIAKEQLRIQQQEAQQTIKQLQNGNKDTLVPGKSILS